jgi:hypothetical protein
MLLKVIKVGNVDSIVIIIGPGLHIIKNYPVKNEYGKAYYEFTGNP